MAGKRSDIGRDCDMLGGGVILYIKAYASFLFERILGRFVYKIQSKEQIWSV